MPRWLLVGASVLGLVLWLAWVSQAYVFTYLGVTWDPGMLASWGDTFGALNALFAAFAAISILYTLRFQQRQITEASRDMHRQRFESTFFELLHLLREEREKVRFRYSAAYLEARGSESGKATFIQKSDAIGTMAMRAAVKEAQFWIDAISVERKPTRKEIEEIYQRRVHGRYESSLGPYFRLIYSILNRIYTDKFLTIDEKHDYGRLVRNQLTSYEAALAGINGLSPVSKDFPVLVTEFRLLKYLSEGRTKKMLREHYPPETFAGRRNHHIGI